MIVVLLILLVVVLFATITIILWTLKNSIPPVPSSPAAKNIIVSVVKEKTEELREEKARGEIDAKASGDEDDEACRYPHIVELGSGWGTVAGAMARAAPSSRVIGYENSPFPYLFSRLHCRLAGFDNLTFKLADFTKISLEGASIIVCYLYPEAMEMLKEKIETGTTASSEYAASSVYVVSNTFHIPGWEPDSVYTVRDLYKSKIYVYKIRYA